MNLPVVWRDRADQIEPYAPTVAKALRDCASELEASLRVDAAELVSPAEAAIYSNYSADRIGKMIREEKLKNYGTKRRPKVRRADLPRKPRRDSADAVDLALMASGAVRRA
ncbi:MAG TPA: hypothetical protein VE869_16025 [Gemmatimonas sp.]|nr:hypothetical protein [Gemmatimonas sp.]